MRLNRPVGWTGVVAAAAVMTWVAATLTVIADPKGAHAADPQVTLMLGGKFCDFYPKEVTEALNGIKGVKKVDLKSAKGHAIVDHDGSVKPEDLAAAVNKVKGTKMGMEWHCTAEVMR